MIEVMKFHGACFRAFSLPVLFVALCLGCACGERDIEQDNLQHLYDFRDTRQIVSLLLRAEKELKKSGREAFNTFGAQPDDWSYKDGYLYVYSSNCICLFHGGMPELEGQDLSSVVDVEGRDMMKISVNSARDEHNTHGWIHYRWNIPNRLYPVWKSSCHRLVVLPDGEEVLLGVGMANMPKERAFVKTAVDSAAELVRQKGADPLDTLRDPLSRFNVPDSQVFMIKGNGDTIIAPSFRIGHSRNILDYEDDAGHVPLREALHRLETVDSTWVVLLVHDSLSMNLRKKGLYIRRTVMDGEDVFIGATADLPEPSWMD